MTSFRDRVGLTKAPLMKDAFLITDEENGIACTIAKFGKEINIQVIESRNEGKGNCQKFIKEFKKDVEERGFQLVSSTPINPAWEHICKKLSIRIYQ